MENKKPLSQSQQIAAALENGDKLTGLQILKRFGCLNYKGRIADLRRSGMPIKTQMKKINKRKRVAEYSLIK